MRLDYPDERECRWLVSQGVTPDTIATPRPIRAASVWFWQNTFDFDVDGERSLIFLEDRDAIAWQPRTGALACWRGVAFCLNEEAIDNPATYFAGGALKIHRTPLDWLRADGNGIVIVQPRYAYASLRHARRLAFADEAYARQVQQWISPPTPTAEFLVETITRAA